MIEILCKSIQGSRIPKRQDSYNRNLFVSMIADIKVIESSTDTKHNVDPYWDRDQNNQKISFIIPAKTKSIQVILYDQGKQKWTRDFSEKVGIGTIDVLKIKNYHKYVVRLGMEKKFVGNLYLSIFCNPMNPYDEAVKKRNLYELNISKGLISRLERMETAYTQQQQQKEKEEAKKKLLVEKFFASPTSESVTYLVPNKDFSMTKVKNENSNEEDVDAQIENISSDEILKVSVRKLVESNHFHLFEPNDDVIHEVTEPSTFRDDRSEMAWEEKSIEKIPDACTSPKILSNSIMLANENKILKEQVQNLGLELKSLKEMMEKFLNSQK